MQQSTVTDYFKSKKRPRQQQNELVKPNKVICTEDIQLQTDHQSTVPVAVRFVCKGSLSPKKDLKNVLKRKELKLAIVGINRCSKKLAELRSPEKRFYGDTADKFDDVLKSPLKLLQSPLKVNLTKKRLFNDVAPAYQRYNNLAQKTEGTTLELPYKYKLLLELFNGVETVCSILHNRKEMITFNKVKAGVQELVKREQLKIKHLEQILTVLPQAYQFKYELVNNIQQLCFYIKHDVITATISTNRKTNFKHNLINICKEEHQKFLGSLDPPLIIPVDRQVTRYHPRFKLDEIADIKIGELIPPPPDQEKLSSAKDVLNKAQHILENPRMKKAVQEMINNRNKEQPTTKINNKNKINALKGISKSLIDKIRARENAKSLMLVTETADEQKRKLMMSKMPEFIKILRNIFVAEKKTSLPIDLIIERVGHSGNWSMTHAEMTLHLGMLCELFPDWLKRLSLSQGEWLRMEKNLDINNFMHKFN